MTPSLRRKWLIAALAFGVLALVTLGQQASLTSMARVMLGLCTLGAIVWWARSNRRARVGGLSLPPRLEVVHRVGLSQRTAVALVEVDGQPYLVVHGEGFARVRPTRKPRVAQVDAVLELPVARGWS